MSTLDADYEHLNVNTRSAIRRGIVAMIRQHPNTHTSFKLRFDKAVHYFARKYGVRPRTIERIFQDMAPHFGSEAALALHDYYHSPYPRITEPLS